ncbi:hypothetical protein [Cryobacterium sp. TMT2-42-4]|uniref:hypothetical protein n=1 Tax=Cryobacterium sp. TMT2-42-4 TaxID=1259255 RepID=UPI0010692823|nr:hypothetical protein [Cryobacterium sp. TMT2-42-4]TFC32699.1 hypothetical protein E3O18_14885 [Cryobacterium sp. TMT2-42-4]
MSSTPNTGRVARVSTETKAAFKTTEFIAYILILVAMFIASAMVDNGDDGQGFGASSVWLYATLLTIGYVLLGVHGGGWQRPQLHLDPTHHPVAVRLSGQQRTTPEPGMGGETRPHLEHTRRSARHPRAAPTGGSATLILRAVARVDRP